MQTAMTLASCPTVLDPRCSSCGILMPERSEVESYTTQASEWITVRCPECNRWTPFKTAVIR
jgi:hypothetical protein